MLKSPRISEELAILISAKAPLSDVAATLREYRDSGISREDVMSTLEVLRADAKDDAEEDRILEVMDILASWCSPHLIVWKD